MKLQHHITSLILAIAIATSTALPAAGIPNIKAPPSIKAPVAAPKVPVIKIPSAPKVPTAPRVPVVKVPTTPKIPNVPKVVKVPSAPKIPVAPKVPTVRIPATPKVSAPRIPAVKVPVAPKIAKAPAAPKVPTVKVVSAPKLPAPGKIPTVTNRVVSAPKPAINSARLANLKQKLPVEVQSGITSGKGARFVSDQFAGAGTNKPGTILDSMKQGSGTRDRNPLTAGGPLNNMRGDKNSQASDTGLPSWMGSKRRNGAEDADGGSKTTVTRGADGSVTVVKNDTTTTLNPDGTVVETDKNGKTIALYTNDPEGQHAQIAAANARGYQVLRLDTVLDNHWMQHLEYRANLGLGFVRVDADTLDKLIEKDEKRESVLSEAEQETVKNLFETAIKPQVGASVQLSALAPDEQPVQIVRPEFMRRMKEMQALHGMGMGDFPDSYNVVVNTNHPIVVNKLLKMEEASAQAGFSTYLVNLALLQQGMLRGEALTGFVQETLGKL